MSIRRARERGQLADTIRVSQADAGAYERWQRDLELEEREEAPKPKAAAPRGFAHRKEE